MRLIMQTTFYTIYKTTNTVNNKIYIGKHQTTKLDDDYIGSGKLLKRAINKYGIENFKKEILHVFDNERDMNDKEKELVTEKFVLQETNYNLCVGGAGGFSYINREYWTSSMRRQNALMHSDSVITALGGRPPSVQNRKAVSEAHKAGKFKYDNFKGKRHSKESIEQIKLAKSGTGQGKENSQYGTRWIHSLVEKKSKRILNTEPLPLGWHEGRKIKF